MQEQEINCKKKDKTLKCFEFHCRMFSLGILTFMRFYFKFLIWNITISTTTKTTKSFTIYL